MARHTRNVEKIPPRRLRDPLTRSQIMGRIRSKDTRPEMRTRSAVHALGIRFRVHVADLPGKPDLANKARRWAIFVHGCFWHSHDGCQMASKPQSNTGYWYAKLQRNRERDALHQQALRDLGYQVHTVWECATRNEESLRETVAAFFNGPASKSNAPSQLLDR
ncbi:DNA mismatch endonuclease Vsr [Mesorhizobium sp. VK23B]|uniref:Very short patch repair endonuclease n=1 Tax=Mesorhizobium dulcispinae TaxID=3072316 RepID=A0ABU4XDK0_9HYPH|nr:MULTISPECIES: DNA mismatch endonuclease Vsr [unclassified Mesorhizobium]MDX8464922.1 DNA mismatch endonuclease Vsr [Mesorhizobium sp. VK23B]MDX8472861.1 DNA mismatch endonuclease Vsr [Mesorhizobium sp. VK23A]